LCTSCVPVPQLCLFSAVLLCTLFFFFAPFLVFFSQPDHLHPRTLFDFAFSLPDLFPLRIFTPASFLVISPDMSLPPPPPFSPVPEYLFLVTLESGHSSRCKFRARVFFVFIFQISLFSGTCPKMTLSLPLLFFSLLSLSGLYRPAPFLVLFFCTGGPPFLFVTLASFFSFPLLLSHRCTFFFSHRRTTSFFSPPRFFFLCFLPSTLAYHASPPPRFCLPASPVIFRFLVPDLSPVVHSLCVLARLCSVCLQQLGHESPLLHPFSQI